MDRFEYHGSGLQPGEEYLLREKGVKLYDGDSKTSFENGELMLTSHRLLWGRPGDIPRGMVCLSLSLQYVIFVEESNGGFGFTRNKKFTLHLSETLPGKTPGPVAKSCHNFIKLGFKEGLEHDFLGLITSAICNRKWSSPASSSATTQQAAGVKLRTGIVGIERGIQQKQKATDESISKAFQDLNKLMAMAKDMVSISKTISQKIREKQGNITEDETVRFKSYLLSLGIDDPVTRNSFRSESQYHQSLARQLVEALEQPIAEMGGMMALTDVYCRINRARGLELLSPEDLLNACHMMEQLKLPIVLRQFDSGVMVLQLQSHSDASVVENTSAALKEHGSVTAAEYARILGMSVLLAKEHLLTAEKYGGACRDDSVEGLKFFPNLFLET